MAGYSRENKRQNQALQSILDGGTPEKRIMVAMEDTKEKKERQKQIAKEREKSSERSEALKAARTPWFCPSCDKVMKKRLDDKMYRLYNHCFDCQVEIENKMRIDGTYKEWEEKKVKANTLSWIKEQKKTIEEFKKQKSPEFYQQFRPDGYSIDKEKWEMDMSLVMKQADEALEHLQKVEDSLK
jgi:hypothetical protein|tara:strand:+ start:2098 stop:2649 length:552 start_codon:yes stop_codon:yes gene_type:complete